MPSNQSENREALFGLLPGHLAKVGTGEDTAHRARLGLGMLLDWLEAFPGGTWQERWQSAGDDDPAIDWRTAAGAIKVWERHGMMAAFQMLMCHRIIRPSYARLIMRRLNRITDDLRHTTDRDDFERLLQAAKDAGTAGYMIQHTLVLLTRVLIHTRKRMADLTTDDLFEYTHSVAALGRKPVGLHTAHELLRSIGVIEEPPLTAGRRKRHGRRSVEDLVDAHRPACSEVRGVLVAYLRERATSLDYQSLEALTDHLTRLFWGDIETHHPGINSLNLSPEVAGAWKARVRLRPDGQPRLTLEHVLISVRAFYLDIAQWAAERPEIWGPYAFPCPISDADMRIVRKEKDRRRARTHARIRTFAPVLPRFVAAVQQRHAEAKALLDAARACPEGATFEHTGHRYFRTVPTRSKRALEFGPAELRVRRIDAMPSRVIRCEFEEEDAFWIWAIVEVLRLTGIRQEELLELTHLSIREYRMPDGQVVLLLQIAPSKIDTERVVPICPELPHVLAAVVARAKGENDHIPPVARYDPYERVVGAPLPYLFQWRRGIQQRLMTRHSLPYLLSRASDHAGLRDVDGQPLRFTPHDFRRLFATEAVNGGLPIHIAAKLLGHLDLNTTRGYVAVYSEDVIRHFQAHVARRRALRPTEEYREPTAAEWQDFEKHFRHRKMALGDCYRPYETDCPHEHACVRCPMLRMDPEQLPRLLQIEKNTHDLLSEARENGWEGEAQGLEETLLHIDEKKAQVKRIRQLPITVMVKS